MSSVTKLGALIAYLKTISPVDREVSTSRLSPIGRVLLLAMKDIALLSAERIDHNAPRPTPPAVGITTDYGKYVAARPRVATATPYPWQNPRHPAGRPPALNLTPYPGAAVAQWSEAEFVSTLRTKTARNQLENRYMPWKVLGQMTDDELKAMWLYLKSAPAKEYGVAERMLLPWQCASTRDARPAECIPSACRQLREHSAQRIQHRRVGPVCCHLIAIAVDEERRAAIHAAPRNAPPYKLYAIFCFTPVLPISRMKRGRSS